MTQELAQPLEAGRVNALFVSGLTGPLEQALRSHLTLDDWNLTLRTPARRGRDWAWISIWTNSRKPMRCTSNTVSVLATMPSRCST